MGVYIQGENWATQGPCHDGFHVPLKSERQSVYSIWTALGGGASDGTNFGIALKLPFGGGRGHDNAAVYNNSEWGYYRSATADSGRAYALDFKSSSIDAQIYDVRARGNQIRPFKNIPAIPTVSWTKLYGTSIEAGGIFRNSTDGLISLSSNGVKRITIADKNLGATTVWNSGDALSENNCGYFYQRGNNYGFQYTGTIPNQSSTQVNASAYGPGNYYSSDTFIKGAWNWDSSINLNLRGGEDGNVPVMSGLKNAYIGEYRVPGVNTVAYFPLKEDAVDIKNNISLTSYGTTNYTTVGGVNSAEFTKSNWLYRTDVAGLPQGDVAKTLSIWMYPKGTKSFWTGIAQFGINSEQAGSICGFGFSPNTCDLLMTRGYSTSNTYTLTQNQWSNAVITYSNSVWTLYVNGIAQVTWNTTSPSGGTKIYVGSNIDGTNNTTTFYGNLSSFIIEDKSRTSEQVANYFNQTKSDYGL